MKKIRNKKRIFNEKTMLVTVDLGKDSHFGYIRFYDGSEVVPFKFRNDHVGFSKFWGIIRTLQKQRCLDTVIIGMESTGCYGVPLLHFLKDKPVRLVQVNPKHTKKVKEVVDNSPNKHDKKDPRVIADIIELGNWLHVVIAHGAAAELRELVHGRDAEQQYITQLVNQLHAHVFKIFPEFQRVFPDLKIKTARYLLAHYPTPALIISLGVEQLAELMHKSSRGRIKRERAERLYQYAQHSVGITQAQQCIVDQIQHILRLISLHEDQIAFYEAQMAQRLDQVPESRYILSIPGVSLITAAVVIGELADMNIFDYYPEVEKFAGLNLYEVSSGEHKGKKRISKRGRPLLRKMLFFAAINVVRENGIYHDQYERYLQRGMKKIKALTAISRKLLRLIFVLVHKQCEFDLDYFKQKQEKAVA